MIDLLERSDGLTVTEIAARVEREPESLALKWAIHWVQHTGQGNWRTPGKLHAADYALFDPFA